MNIEIGSKWVKDGEVVNIRSITESTYLTDDFNIILFTDDQLSHILLERDFLEQYKLYEPVYEYQWSLFDVKNDTWIILPDWEYENVTVGGGVGVRLDFTKRERIQ